jgi:hypothetical protein
MPPRTAAARHRHGARPRPAAPRHARRVSGPLRPATAGVAVPVRRGTTGVFERLRALPEHRVVDRLLRGRVWIWLIGALLGGIVAMQVSLLKLNTGISRAVTTTATLERQNANLQAHIGRLSSSERIRAAALEKGMVMPLAGAVEFLRARPGRDDRLAPRRMTPPSETAAEVMRNGGRELGVLAAPVVPVDPATTVPGQTAPVDPTATAPVTTDPAATAPATTDPAATAPATTDPAATAPATTDPAATPPAADPSTGATQAPTG